ncbi:receptor-like protein EIX2 [Cannabis sativa]|uniref:receptor-like protein EIX2 n=1 Tax=Cannabis sativa TaxID=3483 RepID=UPI0029CA7FE2|nr:receptor-like protein EIX2 [Cannabis sativa]XP_060973637.1 receptor-like protein EIX2 [Cannabis sativa]XP_060973638.1 receptor-like protein EIX2 [Cannabis sativa]
MMSILFVVGFMFMLLFSTTANVVNSNERNNTPQCIPKEREALLKFKTTLNDSQGNYLSSWSNNSTTQNCCEWRHITCDDQTSHVVYVDTSGIDTLGGEIDSSLAELHHLKELYLSDMNISRIPKFIGSFKELTNLDLSENPISGIIPPQLGNLTKLEYLDLSKGTSQMTIDNPRWLSQLTSLENLYISNCRLLKVPDHTSSSSISHSNYSFTSLQHLEISQSFIHPATITWLLNSTINLEFLYLNDNNLSGTILHDLLGNISSSSKNSLKSLQLSSNQLGGLIVDDFENTFPYLSELTLDNNQLEGNFPNRLKTFPNLERLDVSHNKFVGLLPDLSSMPNLISFIASNNKFSGTLSESIGKLDNLRDLDVSSNHLSGYVSHVLNLQCPSLKYLDISYNLDMTSKFNSKYPIIPSFKLVFINLASCKLGPEFPNWLQTQTELIYLDISNSSISGPLPNWFPNITSNLNYLNMSHNLLNNNLTNFPLSQEADPVLVDLSSNQFQGSIPPSLLVNATYLYLSNNKFNEFSCGANEWDKSIAVIDISNNNLFGNIPDCWENFKQLGVLNLGYNKLSGKIPSFINMTSIKTLQLRHNNFSGNFPSSLKYCTSLEVLDLGRNTLKGPIPSWIGEKLNNLVFLSLKSNKFYGSIPFNLCQLTQIQILDFSSNNLSGSIPSCIKNFTAMAQINSSETTISSIMEIDHYPNFCPRYNRGCFDFIWYDNNASITWKGAQHEYVRILGLLRVIDLSSNKLTGEIPIEVTHLSQLVALNLSRNNLSGKIPRKIGKLINLEVLDLSHNRISGKIPIGLAEVSYLNYLDLSNNQLSGRIPTGTQLQGFNAATYAMNLCLCGTPLPSSCPGDDDDESSHVPAYDSAHDDNDKNGGEWLDFSWFYKGIGGGFIIGFCGVCGNLLINNSWRASYFRLMQNIGDWLYVMIIIKWNFLRRKLIEH